MSEPPAKRIPAALEIVVSPDPVADAAEWLVERIRGLAARSYPSEDSSQARSEIRLAIPGGTALAAVVRAATQLGEVWRRVALTWVDERCVPVASPESNRGEAMRRGVLPFESGIPAARSAARSVERSPARVLPLFEDGEAPEAAVTRVGRRYVDEFSGALDVVLLGLGEDGHVASLFPGHFGATSAFAAYVPDSPKPPARRITLTRRALASAAHTLLFATGEGKRSALQRLRAGDPTLPATGLPGLVVVTDLLLEPADSSAPLREKREMQEKRWNG